MVPEYSCTLLTEAFLGHTDKAALSLSCSQHVDNICNQTRASDAAPCQNGRRILMISLHTTS